MVLNSRGVVVRERGGTPFRQIFWNRNGAPANIVGHRWNANTEAFRQITLYSLGWPKLPPNAGFGIKNLKKNSGGDTLGPAQREGPTPSRTHHQHGYTPCAGAQAPPLLGPRSWKPFPQIKNLPLHTCWIVVQTTIVSSPFSWWTHWAPFLLILETDFGVNFVSFMNFSKKKCCS